jgi:hypothetical protein
MYKNGRDSIAASAMVTRHVIAKIANASWIATVRIVVIIPLGQKPFRDCNSCNLKDS